MIDIDKRSHIEYKNDCWDFGHLQKKHLLYKPAKFRVDIYDYKKQKDMASFPVNGKPSRFIVHPDKNLLYIYVRTYDKQKHKRLHTFILEKYDISNPLKPKKLATYNLDRPSIVKIDKDMIVGYFSKNQEFKIYDLDLRLLKTIALKREEGNVRHFYIKDNLIYMARGRKGIETIPLP